MSLLAYAQLKSLVQSAQARLKWIENNEEYILLAVDGSWQREAVLQKGTAEASDFESSLKLSEQIPLDPRFSNGIPAVQTTPRTKGFSTVFLGAGDDPSDVASVGGNSGVTYTSWHHEIGDAMTKKIYVSMNTALNETHVQEGYLTFKDALNDRVSVDFVPKLTPYIASTNTQFSIWGDLIVPAAGDGNINITPGSEVFVSRGQDLDNGGLLGAGFWNADLDVETGIYSNLAPAPQGDGIYNMFASEQVFTKFVNQVHALGNGTIHARAADKSDHPHNVMMRITVDTVGPDHEWWGNLIWTSYRRISL